MTGGKVYLVLKGRNCGIYSTWKDASRQVTGFKGAKHRAFPSEDEALLFWEEFKSREGILKDDVSSELVKNALPIEGRTLVYTDGSARDGKTGYGIVAIKSDGTRVTFSDSTPYETNNQAELYAILKTLESFPDEPLTICSDSTYTIDSLTFNICVWKKNGWKKSNGEDIKNRELIEKIFSYLEPRQNVKFEHVDAHSGILLNEMADGLANLGRAK